MRNTFALVFILSISVFFVARSAEAVNLEKLNGEVVSLDSLFAHGPVLINFWATWCGPCRLEMPHLETIYKDLKAEGVQVAAVSIDNPRWKDRVKAYVEKKGFSFPVYLDGKGELARAFKVMAIPMTVLMSKDGEIVFQTRGYRPGSEILLKKKIESYLRSLEKDSEKP